MRALALALWIAGCAEPAGAPLPLGESSASCGGCHEDHHDEWALSPHGTSNASPVLAAMLPIVEGSWGELARDRCVGCHSPGHAEGDDAIGCLSCHAAVGNHAERDGMLAVDPSAPLAGPFADAEPTIAHGSRTSELLESPSLCGTCHELTGPAIVDEPTLTEYRASPQAAEGTTCADCHLPREGERPLSNDSVRVRPVRSHRFVGFDPPWGAPPHRAAQAAAETRALLAAALALRVERAEDGVVVTVANAGAGHAVPTGATFLRDLWVDVEIDGVRTSRAIVLGDQPMRGEEPVPLLMHADRVEHGSLAAGAERSTHLAAAPDARVTATLYGRAIRDGVLDALDLRARAGEIPTHTIAVATAP